ncbi:unnamed protein product [Moneuplotes crassus]|uniref:Uncharacterized protein n=1 Tax=Euplotes crassus TaxID=5936 RepID=A0AAD2D9D3_EUPCR|nr:unnamed protein product [Moneuplotes crassus]
MSSSSLKHRSKSPPKTKSPPKNKPKPTNSPRPLTTYVELKSKEFEFNSNRNCYLEEHHSTRPAAINKIIISTAKKDLGRNPPVKKAEMSTTKNISRSSINTINLQKGISGVTINPNKLKPGFSGRERSFQENFRRTTIKQSLQQRENPKSTVRYFGNKDYHYPQPKPAFHPSDQSNPTYKLLAQNKDLDIKRTQMESERGNKGGEGGTKSNLFMEILEGIYQDKQTNKLCNRRKLDLQPSILGEHSEINKKNRLNRKIMQVISTKTNRSLVCKKKQMSIKKLKKKSVPKINKSKENNIVNITFNNCRIKSAKEGFRHGNPKYKTSSNEQRLNTSLKLQRGSLESSNYSSKECIDHAITTFKSIYSTTQPNNQYATHESDLIKKFKNVHRYITPKTYSKLEEAFESKAGNFEPESLYAPIQQRSIDFEENIHKNHKRNSSRTIQMNKGNPRFKIDITLGNQKVLITTKGIRILTKNYKNRPYYRKISGKSLFPDPYAKTTSHKTSHSNQSNPAHSRKSSFFHMAGAPPKSQERATSLDQSGIFTANLLSRIF